VPAQGARVPLPPDFVRVHGLEHLLELGVAPGVDVRNRFQLIRYIKYKVYKCGFYDFIVLLKSTI
jgi:hypothetical protein